MGRHKTPIARLKILGSLDRDKARHAGRGREPAATGKPTKPRKLGKVASAFWDKYVPGLVATGVAKSIDAPALEAMCQWWQEYQRLYADSDVEDRYRVSRMAAAHKQWVLLASKFGMSPVDRTRIETLEQDTSDLTLKYLK